MYLATEFAKDCCSKDLIFESDNEYVITVLNKEIETPNLYVGNVVLGISNFFKESCIIKN